MNREKEEIIRGIHYETGKKIRLSMQNGLIKSIQEYKGSGHEENMIAPGLVDIQINGYMGIDFNDQQLEESEWKKVVGHLAKVGVTTFYPTVITNSFEKLVEIFSENTNYLHDNPDVKKVIGGFHLEGPYISMDDGPRGAHSKEHVRAPCWEEFCNLQEKALGMIKLLTMSPEYPNSAAFIRKVSQTGVKVAIGHTSATTEQIRSAVDAGAVMSTHLGNGAHATLPRHPNYIWDQLAEEDLWATVISDGHHLPINFLKVVHQVKGEKKILVSDSVALAGMSPGDYTTPVGGKVTLTNEGRLHLRDDPELLAGSAMNLLQGVQYLVSEHLVGASAAIQMASIYPAKLMNLPQAQGLSIGAPADLMIVNQSEGDWEVIKTYKAGKLIDYQG